jgi:hypothetical protein
MAQGDLDPESPTARVQQYLQSRGLPLTAQNVHNVLQAQASGMPVFENMTVQKQDAGSSAGGKPKGGGAGGGGGSRGAANNPPPVNLGGNPGGFETVDEKGVTTGGAGDTTSPTGGGSPTTSAQPSSNLDLSNMILTGLGLGGAGAGGLYGASKYFGRGMPVGGAAADAVPNFTMPDTGGGTPLQGEVIPPDAPGARPPATVQAEPAGRGEVPPTGRIMDVDPNMISCDLRL